MHRVDEGGIGSPVPSCQRTLVSSTLMVLSYLVLQEFESVDAAAALMGSDWRKQTFYGQHRLRFE